MACSKAEDLINQLIEATLKLLDFGLNIMDALRVQKLLTIRNQKIGLISDDACLPECSLRFSLNFDLMMFNKLLRSACLRARATLNELRVCRLRYPNAPLVLEPKTKVKFHKLQKKIQEFDDAVRSDKMIARRDLRDFREIAIIFSQLEHDLKLLICSLECASTMKDTVLFAAPITDVMTVLSIVLNRLERLAQKAEIDEKIAAAEQQKALQDQKNVSATQSTSATPVTKQESTTPMTKSRTNDILVSGKNTNRTAQQRQHDMTAMIAAASQLNIRSDQVKRHEHHREKNKKKKKKSMRNVTPQTTRSDQSLKESDSIDMNNNESQSKVTRHVNRHYVSIKSNVRRHRKKLVHSFDNLSHEKLSTNPRRMKQFRNEFIRKWTDDARHTYTQKNIIPSSSSSSSSPSSNQLVQVNLKKHQRHETASHSSSSSTSILHHHTDTPSSSSIELCNDRTKAKSSNSISLSSNNNAFVYLQSKKSNENIECKIS